MATSSCKCHVFLPTLRKTDEAGQYTSTLMSSIVHLKATETELEFLGIRIAFAHSHLIHGALFAESALGWNVQGFFAAQHWRGCKVLVVCTSHWERMHDSCGLVSAHLPLPLWSWAVPASISHTLTMLGEKNPTSLSPPCPHLLPQSTLSAHNSVLSTLPSPTLLFCPLLGP